MKTMPCTDMDADLDNRASTIRLMTLSLNLVIQGYRIRSLEMDSTRKRITGRFRTVRPLKEQRE
jgi:hypothetical protein